MKKESIWVIVEAEEEVEEEIVPEGRRSGRSIERAPRIPRQVFETNRVVAKRKRISMKAEVLETQMQEMISIIDGLFNQATTQTGLNLNEVTLSVEIDAEGQLSLLGNGGKMGSKGGIVLKFTRPS